MTTVAVVAPVGYVRPAPVLAATFTVTSTGDSGAGTLRDAIAAANAAVGADTIAFNIAGAGPHVIQPLSALPDIASPIVLDGTAEAISGAPGIVIDGAGAAFSGIAVTSGGSASEIRMLRIVQFGGAGISVTGASGVVIADNQVGTDGTADLGNTNGIVLIGAANTTISGNLISGNGTGTGCCSDGFGIDVSGVGPGTVIVGNRIGTNSAASAAIPNKTYGVQLRSPGHVVGGDTPAERNIISGNAWGGVSLTAGNSTVQGNWIGVDATGNGDLGNNNYGVSVNYDGTGALIGGTTAGVGNVISGNVHGVIVGTASGVAIKGNLIGVGANGTTPVGNTGVGVQILGAAGGAANDNTIGGSEPGAGNVIAHNGGIGVLMNGSNAVGNRILGNVIRDNGALGIDLGQDGITTNDAGDGDSGLNRLQNFPVITSTGPSDISGTLDAAAGSTYRIEIFSNAACDVSTHGEGAQLVGVLIGEVPGPFAGDLPAIEGTFLTATATNETTGDTSEFGPCFEVTSGLPSPGTWVGEKTQSGGGAIPGIGDLVAAGTNAPAGPAQLTYGALDAEPNGGLSSPAGQWVFYTTAATTGTINVPWRWSGFHGFAAVDVLLEAMVIRGLDQVVSNQVLVDAGPQSCSPTPCPEPSGGFDYSGTVGFPVQPGDIYAFRITSSNGDTNASLYGQLILGSVLPQSCAGAQGLYGAVAEGRYVIQPAGGQEFSVYCTGMDGATPRDYLSLTPEVTGGSFNFSSYAGGGAATGSTRTTNYTKVRIDPATLRVDIGDTTFSSSTGGPLTHPDEGLGNPAVQTMSYATAMACNGSEVAGTANVNLRGTPFAIDDTWAPNGNGASGTFQYGYSIIGEFFIPDPQVADITGNGSCGWNSPRADYFLAFNPTPGVFSLQLRYLNESPAPPAPVLFRAIPNVTNTATGVVGRLDAAPGSYAVKLYASTSCTDGALGEDATSLGTADVVIGADDQVYFAQLVTHAASTRRYVAIAALGGGAESALSACVVAQPDNDVWPRAARITVGGTPTTVQGWIDQAGQGRWYRFDVDPGAELTIDLSSMPADYDLFLFKDIQAAYDAQAGLDSADDLTKLSAEFASSSVAPQGYAPQGYAPQGYAPQGYAPQAYAPEAFAPQGYAPQAYAPQGYAPQAYAHQGYAPQAYAPQGYAPQGYAPQAYAPQGYAPQGYAPDIFLPQAYASAQVTSLVGIAAHTGTGDELIVANTWNNAGDFYVRVSGKNGAHSLDDPFQLSVTMQSDICQGIELEPGTPIAPPGLGQALILTDLNRMPASVAGNSATDMATLQQRLSALAQSVGGVVVDVGADPRVAALNTQADLNPACPYAKELVALAIKDIVDGYRAAHPGQLRSIVLVGDDSVIPFFRYPDPALLGPEQDFVPPVDRASTSEASLRTNYVLGQDEYGASVVLAHGVTKLPIPDLAVGRLVETAADISGFIDGFLALSGGVVPTPTSSLVTGYDFIADASDAIRAELQAGIGTGAGTRHDALITPYDVSPLDSRSWTATQLKEQLATRHDLMFLGGHFSADSALAADFSTTMTTADLATVDLANAIVFSIGCHSGYNTVDAHAIAGVTQPLDWAQAFARRKATLVAGTAYQYGDTDFIEYSERIYRDFARELRRGTGPVTVGDALVRAKQAYLILTNEPRGLHAKALLASTLYGLPMTAVNMPGARLPVSTSPSIIGTVSAFGTDPGAELGLARADVTLNPTTIANTKELTVFGGTTPTITATWYSGANGVVTHQNEPAIPLESQNVTVPGKVLRGVVWLGGSYTNETVVPLTGAPATEVRGMHTRFASPVYYPIRPWALNYIDALGAGGQTHLLVTPAQHKGSLTSDTAALRRYTSMGFRLYYSAYTGAPALSGPPEITTISGTATGNDVLFEARVTGNPAAGIQEVWVLYTTGGSNPGSGSWLPLMLTQDPDDSTLWRGTATITGGTGARFIVQAVNGLGLVTMNDNYGEGYPVALAGAQPPAPETTSMVLEPLPAIGTFGDTASVTAALTAGTQAVAGKPVLISIGSAAAAGTTGVDGRVTVAFPLSAVPGLTEIRASFAGDDDHAPSSASRSFEIRKAPATITLTVPPSSTLGGPATAVATLSSGGRVLAQRTVAFLITAPGASTPTLATGLTDLLGQARLTLPTTAINSWSVQARFGSLVSAGTSAVDLTDAFYLPASSTTGAYPVYWPFAGFFAPVNNIPVVNTVKAGAAIPVKFSLGGNRGLAIFRSGYPKVVQIPCAGENPVDPIESTVTANSSGLQYDSATGQYTYVWKTAKTLAGKCYEFQLGLIDGSTKRAIFKFS